MILTRRFSAILICLLALSLSVQAQNQKLRVEDGPTAERMLSRGGKLVADYGTFKIIQADAASVAGETNRVESAEESNFIELHAARVDTRTTAAKALRQVHGSFRGQHLHLIQFAAPVKPEWRQALEQTGVKIVSYIPQNAYLIYGDAAALTLAQAWAGTNAVVQWEGVYQNDWKINPAARATNATGQVRWPGTSSFAIQLVDDPAANTHTLAQVDALKLAPVERESRGLGYRNLFVQLPPERLAELATNADVVSIQPYFPRKKFCERQAQIMAGNLTGNVPSGPGYLAWLATKGFTQAQFDASGFVVDVTDSGVDNGTTTPNHFGLHTGGGSASRVAYARLEGTANTGSTLQGCDGHGNLNAHIIGGYDDLTGSPFADATGYHYGLGICPFVKVGSSVIFDSTDFTSPSYDNMLSRAYRDGARVSNNSWGADTAGAYDADAQNYDALVRDAQPGGSAVATAGNQEMVIVFAAGNAGSTAQTVGSPGTGKNIICVGAGENVQAFGAADGSGVADSGANSANDVISFSSRGPCDDGRFKPDLCAPGTHVSGGVAQAANPTATGTAIACFDGSGVSGGTGGSFYFPAGQQFYTASSGTSHSTPGISGACALLRQYFINRALTPPSPAMTKAYLVNSTRYMTGTGAAGTLPSNSQGLGSVNLGTAFDGVARVLCDQTELFTASGQSRQFTGSVGDAGKPFRVTLAWTDAPGSTTGNAYNNNLDLTVTVDGTVYKGNVFSGASSVTGGTNDTKNNLECVFLPAGVATNFTVTVTAANINSDGVPGNASALDQDFALVIYNAATNTAPLLSRQPASLTNAVGGSAAFTVTATGVAPLAYQWFFNNAALGGATNSSLLFTGVAAANAGGYFVIVTNAFGSATSAVATLTVTLAPVITQSPASQSVLVGQPAAFSVTAAGAPPLVYQWRFNGNNLAGATGTNYAIAAVAAGDAGSYDVFITNASGSVTSSVAVLTAVNPAAYSGVLAGWDFNLLSGYGASPLAAATSAPNVTVTGLTRGSGVTTSGTAAARAWGGNGFTSASAAAAVAANLFATCDLTANAGYLVSFSSVSKLVYRRSSSGPANGVLQYQVGSGIFNDLTNLAYSSSSSGAAVAALDLSGIAALQNVPAGTKVTFRLVNYGATSSGGNWYLYDQTTPAVNDFEISGSLAPASLPVAAPVIASQPAATNVFAGKNASLSVTATGNGPLSYQWLQGTQPLTAAGPVAGTRTNVLSFLPAATNHTGSYSVIITNLGGSVTSSVAALNVVPVPALIVSGVSNFLSLGADGGAAGNPYVVERATNLTATTVWVPVQTNVIGTNGQIRFSQTNQNGPAGFYRLQFP